MGDGAYGKFMLRRPLRTLFFHDGLQFQQRRQRDRSRRRSDIKGRIRRKPQQRAKLPRKRDCKIVPRVVVMEDASIRALCQVGAKRHSPA